MKNQMKTILYLIIFIFIASKVLAQSPIINPKNCWYFGFEIGNNTITSYDLGEQNKSFQGGILSEYYFAKHWSISGRLKYFKTGLSFISSSAYGQFDGAVISVPMNCKWEFKIIKNLSANLKFGVAYNYEIQRNYTFSQNITTDYPKSFASLNSGIGVNYFVSKEIGVFVAFEQFRLGGYKGKKNVGGYDFNIDPFLANYTNNNLINIGVKYNFKKGI